MRQRLIALSVAFLLAVGSAVSPRPALGATSPFTDIAGNTFEADIDWLYAAGITVGCSPTLFCPKGSVSRAQMASFLVRTFHLPPTATDYFTDDTGSVHENDINALREAGVTVGCGPNLFCPSASVTRQQMASFLIRAVKGFWLELGLQWLGEDEPGATSDPFDDDAASVHQADINALAALGITKGCAATLFCPGQVVTREQMAAFLHRSRNRLEVLPRTGRAAEMGIAIMFGQDHDLVIASSSSGGVDLSGFTARLVLTGRELAATNDLAYASTSSYTLETLTDIDVDIQLPPTSCSVTIDSTLAAPQSGGLLEVDVAFVQPPGEPMTSIRFEATAIAAMAWSLQSGDWGGDCPADVLESVKDDITTLLTDSVGSLFSTVPALCRGDDTALFTTCP